ncbi:homocysteine S-methyltransferase [Rhizobium favelukesii]|uniref:Homocysteine S-methyltransferase n=1 Tax=Rhizobium favelukesii TaxID=348824 RepID=W6RDW5_9HYPH|nr:homocysteine S-methyltransferase [Rhizobium favelukesii]
MARQSGLGREARLHARSLHAANVGSVSLLAGLRGRYEQPGQPIVISGAIGPRGDGYKAGDMDATEAEDYHGVQIGSFAESDADMVTAFTLTNIDEAIGAGGRRQGHALRDLLHGRDRR